MLTTTVPGPGPSVGLHDGPSAKVNEHEIETPGSTSTWPTGLIVLSAPFATAALYGPAGSDKVTDPDGALIELIVAAPPPAQFVLPSTGTPGSAQNPA